MILLLVYTFPKAASCPILNQALTSRYLQLLSHGYKDFRAFLAGKQLRLKMSQFSCGLYLRFQVYPTEKKCLLLGMQVVSKLPKGCIWAPNRDSEMREPGVHLNPWQGCQQRFCRAHLGRPLPTWHRGPWNAAKSSPSNQTDFLEFSMHASFSHY